MANSEHVEMLKKGVAEWNQWREEHPEILLDLSFADLKFADLIGVNLSSSLTTLRGANLMNANLSHANLSHANICETNLNHANLNHANLSHAYLWDAYLGEANLKGADLSFANLGAADLTRANLSGANLSEATLSSTIFAEVDLRATKGLIEIDYRGRSIIELHSVRLPQDGSALHFLRGVGAPDEWIDFYRALTMQPIQYHSCFVSYSNIDESIAKRLHADLQANGVRCWFAPHDLKPGDYFREEIDKAIHMQEKLLLILSKDSVESRWVKYEVNRALNREIEQDRKILFPIRLDDTILNSTSGWAADLRAHRHIGDFTGWQEHQHYQEAFTQLLHHLRTETE